MPNRWRDWLAQAERDLAHAERSAAARDFEWACFAAHQAAEKAIKALHLKAGQQAWGHALWKLLGELPANQRAPDDLVDRAKALDNFYVPTRYPNGYAEGAPFQYFGKLQAEEAIRHAGAVLEFIRAALAAA